MVGILRSLWRHQRLIKNFVVRDLKARYVGSTMGFFWSVIFPIVNLFVFMFVFRFLLKARFGDGAGVKETAFFMLAGILVWAAFAETLTRTTSCLVDNANLIQKVVFPSEILPVNLTLSSLVNMLIGLPIVVIGIWVVSACPLGSHLIVVPLLLLVQALFTIGLGYLLATLNVLWRDTFHLVGVGVQVWMFATPIFYPEILVRNSTVPMGGREIGFAWLLEVNPMHWLIDAWRTVLLRGAWPDWTHVLRFTLVALVVFAVGATFFSRQKRSFPDLL